MQMITFNVSSILFYYICVSTPQAILFNLDLRFYWDTAVQSMWSAKIKQNLVLTSGHPTFSKEIVSGESAATAARRENAQERATFELLLTGILSIVKPPVCEAPHSSSLTCSIYLSLHPSMEYIWYYNRVQQENIVCYLT